MNESSESDSSSGDPPPEKPGRPLIFGEALVDRFPDGQEILGGAPFNVAWNLKGLGFDPYFVSGIGDDPVGALFRSKMEAWGIDQRGLQTVPEKSTGTVVVSVDQNEPSYEFQPDQAYDNIAAVDSTALSDECSLLYYGSLVFRSEPSRTALRDLISSSTLPRFVDINIRQPHFEIAWLPNLLGGARWIKLNAEELSFLSGTPVHDEGDVQAAVDQMRSEFGSATYFITWGAKGAYAVDGNQINFAAAPQRDSVVDSVGAGDGFSAATIGGILNSESTPETLDSAVRFAARLCGIQGATCDDRELYEGNP